MKLRCYCCGEPIGGMIALVSMTPPPEAVDRVFVFLPDHVERTEYTVSLLVVEVPEEGSH
jgi:hypothetical protein